MAKIAPSTTRVTNGMLKLWTENNLNVLMIARHGVGKTSMIRSFWEEQMGWVEGETYKYLSASTLDPWVDVVGIPTPSEDDSLTTSQLLNILSVREKISKGEITEEQASEILCGNKEKGPRTIDFLQPTWLKNVKAIFVDELNRSHPKVRNALMEFIQFKSVNGNKLDNLRMVWGAINPDDDEEMDYDVEKLDPATFDRFQIHIYLPNEPNFQYFAKTYGSDLARAVIDWYKEQTKANPAIADHLTPRRLEYVIQYAQMNGDIRHIIPDAIAAGAHEKTLMQAIRYASPIKEMMRKIYKEKDTATGKTFIADENNYSSCIDEALGSHRRMEFWLPLLPKEKLSNLFMTESKIQSFIFDKVSENQEFKSIVDDIYETSADSILREKIIKAYGNGMTNQSPSPSGAVAALNVNPDRENTRFRSVHLSAFGDCLKRVKSGYTSNSNTYDRSCIVRDLSNRLTAEDIPVYTARELLLFLEMEIVGRSHIKKLAQKAIGGKSFKGIMSLINVAIESLSENTNFTMRELTNDFPKIAQLCLLLRSRFYWKV